VDFRNAVVIMTSNIGSEHIQELLMARDERPEHWADLNKVLRDRVMEDLRKSFKPEFLNRVDEVLIFNPLTRELLREIVDIQLRRTARFLEQQQIEIELTDAAKQRLSELGYDPMYGARPLKRTIQKEVLDPLALRMLDGSIHRGDTVEVDFSDGKAVFNKTARKEAVEK
jgi:ATP-dependent Clp protease ATP-binding subunit ClpB